MPPQPQNRSNTLYFIFAILCYIYTKSRLKLLQTDGVNINSLIITYSETFVHQAIVNSTFINRKSIDATLAGYIILKHIIRMGIHLSFINQVMEECFDILC